MENFERQVFIWVDDSKEKSGLVCSRIEGHQCLGVLDIVWVKVAQSCPTLCDPMDYTVHGILQTRILEWVAFPFLRGSSQPRDRTQVSHTAGRFFTSWATREAWLKGWQVKFILQRNSWTSEKKTRRWVWWKWEEKNMKCGMTEINEWWDDRNQWVTGFSQWSSS